MANGQGNRELERRQLTVLFCDLVGSTELSRRLDPEDFVALIRAYREAAGQEIARYGGFIARFVGDGILAYFGYPVAQEDAAARAIRAALAVIDAPAGGQRAAVRIAIATGQVIVGDLVGDATFESSTAMGETPNLAARLLEIAAPNTVIVSEATRDLVGGQFELVDVVRALKGFGEEVRAFRVLKADDSRSRFEAAARGGRGPLVGREAPMSRLMEDWRQVRQGRGRVTVIHGEAGIGKSALAQAFSEVLAAQGYRFLRMQCSSFHANTPLHPFIRHVENAAALVGDEPAEAKLAKLAAWLTSQGVAACSVALFARMLSIATPASAPSPSPERLREALAQALLDYLDAACRQAPLLVVFEDAHWIDATSAEVLAALAPRIGERSLMLVISSRQLPRTAWIDHEHARVIPLERLDRHASARLLDGMLPHRRLSAVLVEDILSRSDGVPLYIEELAKSVDADASGTVERAVPATLRDSLMARIDQLGDAKKIAQVGAVIGREFTGELLGAISPVPAAELAPALERLVASTVLFRRTRNTYCFKHALLQDAAYDSLLRSARQELHHRLAEALVSRYADRAQAEPEVVAHHYAQAGKPLAAALHWTAAATRALERFANQEALAHAGHGLEALEACDHGAERDGAELPLQIIRGTASRVLSGFSSFAAEQSFARAHDLGERLGDASRLIEVRRGLFACYYARGALALARVQGDAVVAAGEHMDDAGSRMLGHWMLGCVAFWQGRFPAARDELEQASALYDPARRDTSSLALQIDPGANSRIHLCWVRWVVGDDAGSLATCEEAIAGARRLAQPFAIAMALFWAGAAHACAGRLEHLSPLVDELTALAARHRLRYLGSCARVLDAARAVLEGRHAAAIAPVELALEEFGGQQAGLGIPWALSICATAHLESGAIAAGLETVQRAFESMARNGERHWEAELWRLKGELLARRPGRDRSQALASVRRACVVAHEQGAGALEQRALQSLRVLEGAGAREPVHEP